MFKEQFIQIELLSCCPAHENNISDTSQQNSITTLSTEKKKKKHNRPQSLF